MPIKTFTATDISNIYDAKVRKSDAYFRKYETLDRHLDGKIESLFVDRDYPRIPCILDFKEWIKKHNIKPKRLLVTCTNDFELNYVTYEDLTYIPYDGDSYDLHTHSI